MSLRTTALRVLPWGGGLNTSLDEALISPDECILFDQVTLTAKNTAKKREGNDYNWDDQPSGSASVVGGIDYWYEDGAVKTKRIVRVLSNGTVVASEEDGTSEERGSVSTTDISKVSLIVAYDRVWIACDNDSGDIHYVEGVGNATRLQDSEFFEEGASVPPKATVLQYHHGRLWANDTERKDRLHWSETGNPFKWGGYGDSGARDVGFGDGDPEGLTAIFPPFRGEIFVAKRTKLYKVPGFSSETYIPQIFSTGVGCVGANAVTPIGSNDVVWVSLKGIHSLNTTSNYGDYDGQFISKSIQPTFNNFNRSRLKNVWAAYDEGINSVAFTFSESGANTSRSVYFYNTEYQKWYTWLDIEAECIFRSDDTDKSRFYLGGTDGRLGKTLTSRTYDIRSDATQAPILYGLGTGRVFPDGDPYTLKGYKRVGLIFTPAGNADVTAVFQVDDFAPQTLVFDSPGGDLLGDTFILGQSDWGVSRPTQTYTRPVDGWGRGFKLTVNQSGVQEDVEILGYMVEYELAEPKPEPSSAEE